jgi:hypothetical protein
LRIRFLKSGNRTTLPCHDLHRLNSPFVSAKSEHSLLVSADYKRLDRTDFALAYAVFRFLRCPQLGIGFVPWGPVGQGYLTAKIDAQTKSCTSDAQRMTRGQCGLLFLHCTGLSPLTCYSLPISGRTSVCYVPFLEVSPIFRPPWQVGPTGVAVRLVS